MKTVLIKLTLLISLINFSALAQSVQWQKVIGNPQNNEIYASANKIHSNLFVQVGSYEIRSNNAGYPYFLFTNANGDSLYNVRLDSFPNYQPHASVINEDKTITILGGKFTPPTISNFAMRVDTLGNILWTRLYNQPSNGGTPYQIELLPDGYMMLINKSLNNQAYSNSANVIRTDLQGNVVWQKDYGFGDEARAVTPLKDGSYMLLCWTQAGSSASAIGQMKLNLKLVQILPQGDTLMTKIIGSPTNREFGHSIKQTSDGGFIIVGDYVQNVSNTKKQGYALKLDGALNIEWETKIMPDAGHAGRGCELYQVQETVNGDFVVSGYWEALPYYDRSYVARISATGAVTWEQKLGLSNLSERFLSMMYNNDGTTYLSGYRANDYYMVKMNNMPQPYQPNYCQQPPVANFTFKAGSPTDSVKFTDMSVDYLLYGNISKWEWDFGDGTKRTVYTQAEAAKMMHKYQQVTTQLAGTAVRLMVTNNLFCTDTLVAYPFGLPTAVNKTLQLKPAQLYPQPMREQATLQLTGLNQTKDLKLEVVDMLGKVQALTFTLEAHAEITKLQVKRGNLAAGMYVYRLLQNGQIISSGKVVTD